MFIQDYILNGRGHGEVGSVVGQMSFDPGYRRPYFDVNGERVVDVCRGMRWDDAKRQYVPKKEKVRIADLMANGIHSPVFNSTSLRKEEWLAFDTAVLKATRQRLKFWGELMSRGLTYSVPGMSKMILEHETASDPGTALVDMDGLSEGQNDAHRFQLEGLPLPITHSDFRFSLRELSVSRNTPGSSMDTLRAEAAGRRVAETIEQMAIFGNNTLYGGNSTHVGGYGRTSDIYGLTDFTNRNTQTLTTPTGSNPDTTVGEVLTMRETLYRDGFFGPFMIFHSTDWDNYMDRDYAFINGTGWAVNPSLTLRDRLSKIDNVVGIQRLDYLTATLAPYTLIMVSMQPETIRAIVGMDMTTVQWEEKGGMDLRFKVMCIMVPQVRADFNGNCGIVHGAV